MEHIRKVSIQHGVLKKTMLDYKPEGSPFSYTFSNSRQVVNELGATTTVEDVKLFFATTEQAEILNGFVGKFVHARIRNQRVIEEASLVSNSYEDAQSKSTNKSLLKSFLNKLRIPQIHRLIPLKSLGNGVK